MYPSSRQPAYAPTPYSHIPPTRSATINLDEEVKLSDVHASAAERDQLDSLAEIYGIVLALDALEKAFNRDLVRDAEYAQLCNRLLLQYRSNLGDERVAREFGDLESFKRKWDIDCPRATERLRVGLPSTMTHAAGPSQPSANAPPPGTGTPSNVPGAAGTGTPGQGGGGGGGGGGGMIPASVKLSIDATENFITFLDALKLELASKDQLHPLLSEVIQSANKATDVDFEGRANIIKWLIKLNNMKAHEELSKGELREIEFEMEAAYRGFKSVMT